MRNSRFLTSLIIASLLISIPGILNLSATSLETLIQAQERLFINDKEPNLPVTCPTVQIAVGELSGNHKLIIGLEHPVMPEKNNTLIIPSTIAKALGVNYGETVTITIGATVIKARVEPGSPGYTPALLYVTNPIKLGKPYNVNCSNTGLTKLTAEINNDITRSLNKMSLLLAASLVIPIISLGLQASEHMSAETIVTRMIGLPRRTLIKNLLLTGILIQPLLIILSFSASFVLYSTAAWISEAITHTVIPRPLPLEMETLLPHLVLLQTLLWTGITIGVYRRARP